MRLTLLYILVASLTLYAWKDWFRALCGLIVLMAVVESGEMPKGIMGIQGLNAWNILMVSVFLSWACRRHIERPPWDMPRGVSILLAIFLLMLLVGFLRAVLDREMLGFDVRSMVSDQLINTYKWLIPGLLLFDGCRTHERLRWAIPSLLLLMLLIALQVYRVSPLEALADAETLHYSRLKFDRRVGYNAVDVAAMLAGGFWATVAYAHVFPDRRRKALLLGVALVMLGALGLTGGRAGFITWAAVGVVLCVLRWRKYLLLAPLAVAVLTLAFPGPVERILRGFGELDPAGQEVVELDAATSGRAVFWPAVIREIEKAPLLGHGREAMGRTGIAYTAMNTGNPFDIVGHPHNIYLEWTLDHGLIGLAPVLLLFFTAVRYAGRLFRSPAPWAMAAGGFGLSMILAQLIAGLGSQHFYPSEGNMVMWTTMFLVFRVHTATTRRRTARPAIRTVYPPARASVPAPRPEPAGAGA